ncbi:VWA domain-containing protein [Natrialba sp. INN-245]|uniref:VWA domain-containing protein n=1 Tax=Natrialba sp. INN-245 TaxID=2690967 RepID=UPI001310C49B|nr:VWA domain-containing protein [Natrialba sp. INN-245]MWV40752.1 VWA domain-containing protein [Natrialba sp. INN-245]
MNIRRESVLAIVFSVLLVTSLAAPVLGASASGTPEPADGAASVADVQPESPSIQNEEQNESTVPANQSDSSNESGDQSEPLEEPTDSETTNETAEQTETAIESTGSETVNEPAEGSETPDEPSEPPETANEPGAPNLTDEYLTPVERLTLARASISDLENASDGERAHLNGAAGHLDDSLEHYERYRATDRQAYDQQARALHELARAADEGDEEMAEIGRAISMASNDSARIAVHETDVALETFEGEMNEHRYGEAERALEDAERALERGDAALAEASTYSTGREIRTRADAIDHYREAAHHADRALETVEREVDPELEGVSSQPIEMNETVHVRIDAAVLAPDAAAFEDGDLEASVDGESAADASLSAVGPGTTVAGTVALELDSERAENVTVEVRAVSADGEDELGEDVTVDLRSETVRTIRDPETSYTVEADEESTGVTVEATGDGLGPADLSVTDETPSSEGDYRAGPMVRIENRSAIDEAKVTIPLAEGVDPDDGNLSMYTWDPTSEEPWVPVETEIDHENGTATAEVEHFSFFSVFWIGEWEAATSDGMVLEERHLAGNETTDGEEEVSGQIDVVFVVDESGSMSGSPIQYAREAAKRFVGALDDGEQAGLVGYASSASIDRSLTTDHDDLNASIETLSAGGGTHTEAGLREGLDELERNSWENRSSVIILLSDGKSNSGSYPRRVAEDAADRGVEISTVGLGSSIDEDELQDIASITGGDYYHVESSEDLPETFERVAENRTGVQLKDTNDDGIPDAVAEMDLRMPAGSGDVVGEPVDIDPIARDTSGDGLEDHEQVEIEYEVHRDGDDYVLQAEVTNAVAQPGAIDTTGDGLTDHEQLEGWEIAVVDDHDNATTVMEIVDDYEDDREIADYFESRSVSASPLTVDTSGDGLTDAEERALKTDPERGDTTGDGVSDLEALEDPAEDPTVYSTSGPSVYLLDAHAEWTWGDPTSLSEPAGYQYTFDLLVYDDEGVSHVELRQSGVREFDEPYPAEPREVDETVEFYGEGEEMLSLVRGSQTTVTAENALGDGHTEVVDSRHSVVGRYAGVAPYHKQRDLGQWSGAGHGLAELPDFVRLLYGEPGETLLALAEFLLVVMDVHPDAVQEDDEFDPNDFDSDDAVPADVIAHHGGLEEDPLWLDLARGIGADIHRTQDQDNPHESPAESATETIAHCGEEYAESEFDSSSDPEILISEYCLFAAGWYEGYTAFVVAETALGSKGTTKVAKGGSNANDLRRVLDETEDVADTAAIRNLENPNSKTGKINYRVRTTTGQNVEDVSPQFQTAGKTTQAVNTLDEVDTRILRELDETQRTELLRQLADHPSSVQLVNDLGPDATQRLLRSGQADEIMKVHRGLSPSQQQQFARILQNDDLGPQLIRVTSNSEIGAENVETALSRMSRLDDHGHDVLNLKTAREANNKHSGQPPHKEGTIIVDYEIQNPSYFIRVYGGDDPSGGWLMKENQFEVHEITNRAGVLDRFGLNTEWQDYDKVARVTVGSASDSDTIRMQTSTAAKVEDTQLGIQRPGGGTQHLVTEGRVTGWEEVGNIEDFLSSI